ncbi:unnamed protein product [Rotaria sp. Silwood2]|nr:unnamed protein product [Rotaria sp. Silwood2]
MVIVKMIDLAMEKYTNEPSIPWEVIVFFGSIIPSLITIASNIISVYRVRELNRLTSIYILPCRRRTDDTRRILLVITVECLFAIVNSWFSDIILSLVYCKRNLLAGDDCPTYLKQNYDLLVMFDMVNSVSNIILHCLCGKRFRNELRRMLRTYINFLKHFLRDIWCCYFHMDCKKLRKQQYAFYKPSIMQHESSNSSNSASHNHVYSTIPTSPRPNSKHCCDCRWYFNRRPLGTSQQCLSAMSKDCLKRNQIPYTIRYQSLTQRTYITKQTQTRSMRLYYPPQQTTTSLVNKNRFLNLH